VLNRVGEILMSVEQPTKGFTAEVINFLNEISANQSAFVQRCAPKFIRAFSELNVVCEPEMSAKFAQLFRFIDLNDIRDVIMKFIEQAKAFHSQSLLLISCIIPHLGVECVIDLLPSAISFLDDFPVLEGLIKTFWKSILQMKIDHPVFQEAFTTIFDYLQEQSQKVLNYHSLFCRFTEYCIRFDETQRDEKLRFLWEVLQQPIGKQRFDDWLFTYAQLLLHDVVGKQYFIPVNWLMENAGNGHSIKAVYVVLRGLIAAGSVEAKEWAVSNIERLFDGWMNPGEANYKCEISQILCLCLQELVEYPDQFCTILNEFPFRDCRETTAAVVRVISQIPFDKLNEKQTQCVCLGLARMIADVPSDRRKLKMKMKVNDDEVVSLFRHLVSQLGLSMEHFQMNSIEVERLRRISGLE
jgi:hypothetical protein